MKRIIIILFAFLGLISCRNDDDIDISSLVGDWNWVSTTGGISGTTNDTPSSTGKAIVLSFKDDKTYTITTNGTITNQGTFTLYEDVSNLSHYNSKYISFSNYQDLLIQKNEDGILILNDDTNDGFTYIYNKK